MKACYVHVPFCKDICSYCDFTRCRYHHGLCNKWLFSIQKEVQEKLKNVTLSTLYIGGGTPSCLALEQLMRLLSILHPYTKSVKEYTIEANVDSLDEDKLAILKQYGVNRISLGVQTLQEELLKSIARHHNREDVLSAIKKIHQAGIHNVSIDMIYGLPKQSLQTWQTDLKDIVQNFAIDHISLYALTIEEHSTFKRVGIKAADENLEADMYEYAVQFLSAQGFEHYEVSNFAKIGKRSMHNQMYWHYEDFVGIGCGASGKENHQRYDNTKNLQTYFEQGASPTYIPLSCIDERFEMLMMGLRLKDGVDLKKFKQCFQVDLCDVYPSALQKHIESGLLMIKNDYLQASERGLELLNDILLDFLD